MSSDVGLNGSPARSQGMDEQAERDAASVTDGSCGGSAPVSTTENSLTLNEDGLSSLTKRHGLSDAVDKPPRPVLRHSSASSAGTNARKKKVSFAKPEYLLQQEDVKTGS